LFCFVARALAAGAAQHRVESREAAPVKFTTRKMIQFHHCDPAGIVFYPQYFVILSESKEEFLNHIGHPMYRMINEQRRGWPMVRLETDFKRRSRYGDQVEIDIELFKLGGSSLGVQYTVRGEDGERLFAKSIIVLTDLDTGQAVQIGDDMRAALAPYLVEA
jgi:4-hydroxybenzoyl-CoA thioesterase